MAGTAHAEEAFVFAHALRLARFSALLLGPFVLYLFAPPFWLFIADAAFGTSTWTLTTMAPMEEDKASRNRFVMRTSSAIS